MTIYLLKYVTFYLSLTSMSATEVSSIMPDENAPVSVYKQCLNSYQRDIEIMKAQNQELRAELAKSMEPHLKRDQDLRDLQQKCKQMSQEIFELKAERADLSSQLEDRSLQLSMMSGSPRKQIGDLESQLGALRLLNGDLIEDQKRIRKQCKKNEQIRNAVVENYQILREKYKTLKQCYAQQEADIKELKEERARQESIQMEVMEKQIAKNQEIDLLIGENRLLKEKLRQLKETNVTKSDYDQIVEERNELKLRLVEMERRHADLTKELEVFKRAIAKVNARNNKMKSAIKASEETKMQLSKQLEERDKEISSLRDSLLSKSSKVELLEEQNSEMNSRIMKQLKEIIQLRESSEQNLSETNEVKAAMATMQSEKEKLEREYYKQATEIHNRILNLQQKLNSRNSQSNELESIRKQNEDLQNEVQILNSKLAASETKIYELESELDESRSNVDHLISELHDSEDMISSMMQYDSQFRQSTDSSARLSDLLENSPKKVRK